MAIKKSKMFSIKVSPDELATWHNLAKDHGITLSKLIRQRLDNTQPANHPIPKSHFLPPSVDEKLIFQVAAIGNNLNQIARRCNSGEKVAVLQELVAIEQSLAELVELAKAGELKCT